MKPIVLIAVLLLLEGCAAPSLSTWGKRYQWRYDNINSQPLSLQALHAEPIPPTPPSTLHIYIEGDGDPFLNSVTVAPDPTPRDPLTLHLMAQDPAPRVFLARPCYFGASPFCTPYLWTLARYSPIVVQSMANGVEILAKSYDDVVLIGYSGGGTLAVLIAARVAKVSRVITLAANLDSARWTEHHSLSPLSASLNPIVEPPLPVRVRQIHYVGSNDKNILPQWASDFARRQPQATVISVQAFDHRCCWNAHWPTLLENALLATPSTALAFP